MPKFNEIQWNASNPDPQGPDKMFDLDGIPVKSGYLYRNKSIWDHMQCLV